MSKPSASCSTTDPNKKPNVDTRTPEELMNIIEAKGKEVAAALAALRGNKNSVR